MDTLFTRRLEEIRRGKYTFNDVGFVSVKNQLAETLLNDYENGVITEPALNSLIQHYIDQIRIFKRITINDVPRPILQLVLDKMQ